MEKREGFMKECSAKKNDELRASQSRDTNHKEQLLVTVRYQLIIK